MDKNRVDEILLLLVFDRQPQWPFFKPGARDTKLRDNLSLLVSIRGGTPGRARVCENIPRAYFKPKLFTNKNAIILARAFFKPF